MSLLRTRRAASIAAASALLIGGATLSPLNAQAVDYTPIPQTQMSVVDVSSVEPEGELPNGPAALVLDGKTDTFWHTKWQGGKDPLPHHITIKLADEAVNLGQVRLTPRQTSTGSGRVNEYRVETATGDCATATYTERTTGSFPGDEATAAQERSIVLDPAVSATCVKVVYESSWGGDNPAGDISLPEEVASLAEFNADVVADDGTTEPPATDIVIPEGAVELVDGDLKVRVHPGFPQVVDYRLGDAQMAGRLGDALKTVLINEVEQAVTVAAPTKAEGGKSATYKLTFPGLPDVSMDAVASVANGAFTLTFTNLVDPANDVNRLRIPNHNLVTVAAADAESQLTAGMMNVNRNRSGDRFENVSTTDVGNVQGSWMVMANNSTLGAAFDNNASEDNRGPNSTSSRVQTDNNRWQRQIATVGDAKYGTVWSGTWSWLGEPVEDWIDAGEKTIGRDADPFVTVKITADANADGKVDWQDAGIATRDIRTVPNGGDKVKNQVVSRIPFNIVSQATHPFLRTLDDTKRISLATDNLGQKALLKGYQDQGHDSAHPDYADHYNTMAGGLEDLTVLADESVNWNTSYGVHVNVTESYSEAHAFSEDLLTMPPQKAWGWMNQSYYINSQKDLALGNVLDRFQKFYDERPENLDWLYVDVYYPNGWEAERLSGELSKQGWVVSSEWSDKMPNQSIWSHWSQDENYGGADNKGIQSDVIRFVLNSQRDTWNPHPILSNSNVVDFEGWAGKTNYNNFINNTWQRNLPVKFLQQSDIVKWDTNAISFKNGTVASSDVASIPGSVVPTERTFTYDGATVYSGGDYLLPWTDGGEPRLYHYNTGGGSTTWDLTDAWKSQGTLELFKLTDTGREKIRDVVPVDGKITIDGAEDGVAYVLYPTSDVPTAKTPNWGQASHIADPGFFSGNLEAYDVLGNATIEKSARANFQAVLGEGASSISQDLTLPKGTYSAWAWVEVEPGEERDVTVEASGVTKAGYSSFADGKASNTINASTVINSTASDEKLRTNFQRVRVTFESNGTTPVKFTVRAAAGDAKVRVDDLRVVDWEAPVDADGSDDTVYFQDFENVDTGYYPFVTGATNAGGDARTQLAEKHDPYSQKGWWGVNEAGTPQDKYKLNDNVLDGTWSLMANNENRGEILKTSPGAINFEEGRRYRVSFDYQTTYGDQYRVRIGHDVKTATGFAAVPAVSDVLGQKRDTTKYSAEFNASSCGIPFIAIDKLQGPNTQHNMTMDDMRIEDIGASDSDACLSGGIEAPAAVPAGDDLTVTTTVTAYNEEVTAVTHALTLPTGWTSTIATAGRTTLGFGESSVQTWTVTTPKNAVDSTIGFIGTAAQAGNTATVTGQAFVRAIAPLPAGESYLSDMQERVVSSSVGYGTLQWDKSSAGGPLNLRGEVFPKGIGAHAVSQVDFDLKAECSVFQATVGVDDVQGTRGTVTFAVYGDGVLLEQTPVLRGGGATHVFKLDIEGVKTLSLRAGDGGDGIGNDHADWAAARVTCGDEVPPVYDPKVTATPTEVEPGDLVTLALSGFAPSETGGEVSVRVDEVQVAVATIDADGNGTAEVKITDDRPDGELTMIVTQAKAGVEAISVSVMVKKMVEPTPTTTPTVTPTTTPTTTPTVTPTTTPTTTPTVTPTTTPSVSPTAPPVLEYPAKLYQTPGYHTYNGRQWFTKCEPYSATFRCWTSIWSTQVTSQGGKFVSKTGWFHNNLTYLPSNRSTWAGNPLGFTNKWTSVDGRQWYTECDTPATGGNGCRSYMRVNNLVAAKPKPGGGYTYVLTNEWVFNNIVLFT